VSFAFAPLFFVLLLGGLVLWAIWPWRRRVWRLLRDRWNRRRR
jgi:hypothetical protein